MSAEVSCLVQKQDMGGMRNMPHHSRRHNSSGVLHERRGVRVAAHHRRHPNWHPGVILHAVGLAFDLNTRTGVFSEKAMGIGVRSKGPNHISRTGNRREARWQMDLRIRGDL